MEENQIEEVQEEDTQTETQEEETQSDVQTEEETQVSEYDGLSRRLDEVLGKVEALTARLDALGVETVESQGYVDGNIPEIIADEMQTKIDELLGIDALDLL